MKRKIKIMIVLFILVFTSSTNKNIKNSIGKPESKAPTNNQTSKTEQSPMPSVPITGNNEEYLEQLVKEFHPTIQTTCDYKPETDGYGLPLELVNELKEAYCKGESDAWIQNKDDESLRITLDDFVYLPNESDDVSDKEEELNDILMLDENENLYAHLYQCDIDGDGEDEILVVEDYYNGYVYSRYCYLSYCRKFAIFQYNDTFYLTVNYDEENTKKTVGIGLFDLSGDNESSELWYKNRIYIQKTTVDCDYQLLYKNEKYPIIKEVQSYLDEIKMDYENQ